MLPEKILIIDDEQLIRSTTSLLLKKVGVEALCACTGEEGLQMAAKEKPQLILLDLMMPGMDGWEVLARLKGDADLAAIPVLLFTAVDFMASERAAREKGANGVLRKPFHLHQLRAAIGIEHSGGEDHA